MTALKSDYLKIVTALESDSLQSFVTALDSDSLKIVTTLESNSLQCIVIALDPDSLKIVTALESGSRKTPVWPCCTPPRAGAGTRENNSAPHPYR